MAVVFETTFGRLAETVATGQLQKNKVVQFYEATLPQLGWSRKSQNHFWRDGEELFLEYVQLDDLREQLQVYFKVVPHNTESKDSLSNN